MRPACHLIFATCILTTFCPATARCEPDSLWNHNGSVMALYAAGDGRVFRYQEPRIGMRQEGVVSGTVRFEGTQSGNTYSGTAFVFSRRCGTRPYPVTGTASEDGREIKLYGTAPAGFDAACRPIAFRKDAVHFSFLRSVNPSPLVVGWINRDQSAAEAAAERARLEEVRAAKERDEQWLRDLREIEDRRLVEMRSFSSQRDGCQKYEVEACDDALRSPHASRRDVIDLRNWRGVAEKLHADLESCRTGSVAACDAALMSPAVSAEQRTLLNEWRIAAAPFKHALTQLLTHAGTVATATIEGVAVIRNLPTSAHVMGGLAAALALAGMALRRRLPLPIGGPHARAPASSPSHIATSTIVQARAWLQRLSGNLARTRDTPGAIAALELAHAYIDEVREADTPGFEDHELRNHHLNTLALASKQLNAAQSLDPHAILEGQDEKGGPYRFSINELKAEALMLAGITHHTFDIKRAIAVLRKATILNANSPHAFYILGLAHAANMNKTEALAALQRAVALNPKNLSYRKELNRVQSLSPGEIVA